MNTRILTTPALVVATAALLALGGCSTDSGAPESPSTDNAPVAQALESQDAREIIDTLETMPVSERPTDLMASIRPDVIVLTDLSAGEPEESTVSMPQDDFYVSIAPYVNGTHDCYFHSLTTCKGEMANLDVEVLVVDNVTGEVVVDRTITTEDNGFFGLWLERDLDATITITQGDLSVTGPLTTGPDDATCVTTMQLT